MSLECRDALILSLLGNQVGRRRMVQAMVLSLRCSQVRLSFLRPPVVLVSLPAKQPVELNSLLSLQMPPVVLISLPTKQPMPRRTIGRTSSAPAKAFPPKHTLDQSRRHRSRWRRLRKRLRRRPLVRRQTGNGPIHCHRQRTGRWRHRWIVSAASRSSRTQFSKFSMTRFRKYYTTWACLLGTRMAAGDIRRGIL